MSIRKAKPEEAPALTQLASDAHRFHGYPDHWIAQADFRIGPEFVDSNDVYIYEENGELLGFYALAGKPAALEQLIIAPAHFGTGVGKQLFLHAMDIFAGKSRRK